MFQGGKCSPVLPQKYPTGFPSFSFTGSEIYRFLEHITICSSNNRLNVRLARQTPWIARAKTQATLYSL